MSSREDQAKSPAENPAACASDGQAAEAQGVAAVGSSAALISACVIVSRITGFVRTYGMAFALGASALSASYQVANTLPNILYELVVGGMLVTAFLPVYMSVKGRLGQHAGNEFASNLLTLVVLFTGAVSLLCMAFPDAVIYTQSFYSDQSEMTRAVFFFRFFAIQTVFYGASSIVSGLLNANRDYLWSSIAPAANNVIVIATFFLYAAIAPANPEAALYIIAVGNPLGVLVQVLIQWPALRRNGIRLRLRIDLGDPALREVLGLGIPALLMMLCSFLVVSVQTAASYSFADNGPSIIAYARLWFTLPYAFLVVPITTAMFTELSDMHAAGDVEGVKAGIVGGTSQILFFMVPFAMYLVVFSLPLVMLYNAGAFTMDGVHAIADYLAVFALALPLYAVNTYLQKICSTLRKMHVFAGFSFVAGAVQVAITMFAATHTQMFSIEAVCVAEGVFYVVDDACVFVYLRHHFGHLGLRPCVAACGWGLLFGALGAAAGAGVLAALEAFVAPLSGNILQSFAYVVAGGLAALVVTFGLAIKAHVPEAAFVSGLVAKALARLRRPRS